ncbi:MAG TPA: acyl-CoA mutase large subunit family protein [Solirubrobacteraceae bacterium]|nr:acyl-CoA mutase large subunit family protein [Solirubrobacteraceae bacterium]
MLDSEKLVSEIAARWQADYDRIAERFGGHEQLTTHSGIPLAPCYFPEDAPRREPEAPGRYPFTRGNLAAQYQFMNWANQPVIGYGLPEQTRARMDLLAEQGMVGYFGQRFYNLVYDLVSHEGLDPDDPAARGRIGQCGMAVYSVRDMERLFDGLDPTKMNVVHITYYQVIPALAQYIAYAERLGLAPHELRGNSMNWYHQSAYVGMSAFPPAQGHKLAVELISYCSKHMPRWNTTNLFGYGVEEAGGTAVQEIGLMLAYGIDLVQACMKAGLEPDAFLPRFGFQIAQANDFFEEIAKVRALRRLWATTMHERFGAQDPRSMHVRIHTHTSGAVLTAQQPLVNLIRATLHTLGAALAGTQAMEVSAYDEALAIPTEEAATLALRTQQVIQEETNVTAVSDPLAGSYYVESLTDRVAEEAMRLVDRIEELGGYTAAQEIDWIRSEIEESASRWREDVDAGRRRVVGVNCYTAEEEPPTPVFRVDPEVEEVAVQRIQELRATRDGARFDDAIGRLREAAGDFARRHVGELGDDRLMEAAIDAARADASTGEMMAALKGALGWRAPHVL